MQHNEWFVALVSGAAAGFAVDTSLFPVDTIKTRLQSKEGFLKSGGFRNLYSGIGSVLLGSAPGSAVFFTFYDGSRRFLKDRFSVESPTEHMIVDMVTASFGEVAACVVRVPVEVVKQRAQVEGRLKTRDVFRRAAADEGLRGFYRGYGSTVMREIPFSIVQFPLWEFLKQRWATWAGTEGVEPWQSACCGFVAGGFSAAVTTPLDVAKTRIMLAQTRDPTASANFARVILDIYKTEGVGTLFSGSGPRTMFVALGGFIFLGIYDLTKDLLNR